uniref:Glutathione S-transferase n=1 Tax=Ursus americanus TaxID=9643 RepID=A0A452QBT6_URSAM
AYSHTFQSLPSVLCPQTWNVRLSVPDSRSPFWGALPLILGGCPTLPLPRPSDSGLWGGLFHSIFSTTAPDYDRSQWLNEKFKLGLDFPNLPYLIDGAHKVTQSNAILRYIARKHNLCGETEEEKIRVDILENEVTDTRMALAMLCYNPDFEKLRPGYLEGLPDKLKLYSQFLGKRPWFAGEKLTYVDFLAYDLLDRHRIFEPKSLEAFPNLKEFMARFEVIPLRLL